MKKLITILLMVPLAAMSQDAPFECDNNYGECGTPEMSGGGQGGGGSVLINNTDLGDSYQSADDYDDDGVEDSFDNCPRVKNSDQFDSDGDSVGDICDNCRSTSNRNQWDLESDGIGDLCDEDLDNDEIPNLSDNCPRVHNTNQSNIDRDDDGDACDKDIDGDGLDNLVDPCPMIQGQSGGTSPELCAPDLDGDMVPEYGFGADNCPGVYNPEQYDGDLDGAGDACDPDLDGDGILNLVDNCNGVFNHEQIDRDRDGRGDEGCDDRFCFVVFGDEENCLDPDAVAKVYSPSIIVETGDTVILRVFSNKPESAMSFTWNVKQRPRASSRETVKNSVGESSRSILYEREIAQRPTFSPQVPGEYILSLTAEFYDGTIDQHDVTVLVGGSVIPYDSGGCSVGLGEGSSVPHLLIFCTIFGLVIRQRLLYTS